MSDEWDFVTDEMVSRVSPPRILKELQDITTKILQEFANSGEPITDDNNVLHRLCMKLEYLLQTCMREKTILGGSKHYWHWMHDSLKRTKRLSDGLRFVQANKEVRTSQGKGRALIRYSLVHQTLADSFQNCLMNQSTCTHYLKPMCVFKHPAYCSLFLNALYEINAVNFDLISKGYDLDTAWPTFASKRCNAGLDQWRLPADRTTSVGSLGSYVSHITSASMLPDTMHMRGGRSANGVMDLDGRGTISSGPPSVDHRVEELVLELNESDQRIQDQETVLKKLEDEAKTAATSAMEKQDILARVLSDLESRNQNLQEAMSRMTTEFQNREESWETKCDQIRLMLTETEDTNASLKQKISVLEQDKRTLEDTVSARMTLITSGFSGTDPSSLSPSLSLDDIEGENRNAESREKLEESAREKRGLEEEVNSLRLELESVSGKIETDKRALASSLTAKFETEEIEWKRKVDCALDSATDNVISELVNVLPMESFGQILEIQSSHEKVKQVVSKLTDILNEFFELRKTSSKLRKENLLQQSFDKEREFETSDLSEKLGAMERERDGVLDELKGMTDQLVTLNEELQNMKLNHEAEISDHQRDMLELKDANFHLEEGMRKEQLANKELSEKLRLLQQKHDDTAVELKDYRQRFVDLQEEMRERVQQYEDGESEKLQKQSKMIKDLEATIARLETEAEEEGKLQEGCIKENERLETMVADLTEKDKKAASLIEELREQIEALTSLPILELEKETLAADLSGEKARISDQFQKSSEISTVLASVTEAFENTEKQYKILNEKLAKKELESADFQVNAIKACIETERALAKKEYDELFGENESRKRMVKSMEKKLETLQTENSNLSQSTADASALKNRLVHVEEEKAEMAKSSNATEQEFIKMAEKLEQERETTIKLKNEIAERLVREQSLEKEYDDTRALSDELKAKLVQLLQEKDALWKECDELKYIQKLQEEGEATEAKWMEDQEARHCLHCGTEFSFIIRKHHCRICGKIFCNDCSKQWIITKSDGKHERCCLPCLERHRNAQEARALAAGDTSPTKQSSPIRGNRLTIDDAAFEDITNEEVDESKEEDLQTSTSSADQSLYFTPSAKSDEHSRESFSSLPDDSDTDTEVLVAAGDVLKVPVSIKTPGSTLFWRFSTDKSIDFQLSYCANEDGVDEQPLIPKCRCNSHSEPVQGEMLSKKAGVYTFEFDNRFSRIMPKTLKYSLKMKDPEE